MPFNKVFTAKELIESAPAKIPMLLEDIFPSVGLVALAGGSDTGKSSVLRQLAVAICKQERFFLDIKLNAKRGAVVYISTEDDSSALSVMLKKAFTQDAKLLNKLFIIDDISGVKFFEDLPKFLEENPSDAIIIDSTSDIIRGDMYMQSVVRGALAVFDRIAKKHDCLVIFLHHTNKSAKGQADKKHLNGSQAFEAKMRAVVMLRKPEGYDSNDRTLQVVKGNYTPTEIKRNPILLEFQEDTLTFIRKACTSVVSVNRSSNEELALMAHILKEDGLNIREIADKMTEDGHSIRKTKVAELLRGFQF